MPRCSATALAKARLRLSTETTATISTAAATVFTATSEIGAPERCAWRYCMRPTPAMPSTPITHENPGLMLAPTMSFTTPFSIRTLPPSFTRISRMPWNTRKLASVTTKLGMPSFATSAPVHSPRSSATAAAITIVGTSPQPSFSRSASTAAVTPAV